MVSKRNNFLSLGGIVEKLNVARSDPEYRKLSAMLHHILHAQSKFHLDDSTAELLEARATRCWFGPATTFLISCMLTCVCAARLNYSHVVPNFF